MDDHPARALKSPQSRGEPGLRVHSLDHSMLVCIVDDDLEHMGVQSYRSQIGHSVPVSVPQRRQPITLPIAGAEGRCAPVCTAALIGEPGP